MSDKIQEKHTISLLVNNRPGVLIRIALVFARRAYNLESVVVSPAQNPAFSRMNLVASGDPETLHRIIKQLNKLVDVIHARDYSSMDALQQELVLVKVNFEIGKRTEILQIAEHFKGESIDLTDQTVTFKVSGSSEKLDAMLSLFEKYGVVEAVRSGKLIIVRGSEAT